MHVDVPARRSTRVPGLTEQLWRDLRLALRRLWATPVFTAFAVVSLALGLGVTTAVYSTVATLLWSTSSIESPELLAVITRNVTGTQSWRGVISSPDFDDLRNRVQSVPALAASSLVFTALDDGARTLTFVAQAVAGNYFGMVRLPLHLGRGIQPADDHPGADPVLVLSHSFWRSKAGADRGIVGRYVRIAGRPFLVIGVAGESVHGAPDLYGDFGLVGGDGWIPLSAAPTVTDVLTTRRDEPHLTVIARMPPGITVDGVAAEVGAIAASLDQSAPIGEPAADSSRDTRSWSASTAAAIARQQTASLDKAGGTLVLLVGLILVVASTNIANLTMGRNASKAHEIAVRRALGASRARLVQEQCVESVVLAVLGGVGAVLVASVLLHIFTTEIPLTNFRLMALRPTLTTPAVAAAGGVLLAALVVFGVMPALHLTRASLRERLAGDVAGDRPVRWKGRRRLITGHVIVSTVFMLVAFAAMRAVVAEARHDPGFDLSHLALAVVDLRSMRGDTERTARAIAALEASAREEPGFESAALATGLPVGAGVSVRQVALVAAADDPSMRLAAAAVPATPGIFQTLGVPILRGRGFDDLDMTMRKPLIVVSERTARQIFGTADVLGRQVILAGAWEGSEQTREVIGVARDTDTMDLFDRRFGAVYVPLERPSRTVIVLGRTSGSPAPMVPRFAPIVRRVDPDLAVEFASTGRMAMAPASTVLRVAGVLAGGLSALAVTLAMLGLYGVLSHVVARRTREIGLRRAVGAEPGRIRRMILGDGLRPVLWGVGLGMLTGTGARLVLRAVDGGRTVSATDPLALAATAVALISAGLLACYLPARRASKVDPNVALRDL